MKKKVEIEYMKKIIIGAGGTTKKLIKLMKKYSLIFSQEFFLCLDNNIKLHNTYIEDISIFPIKEVLKYPQAELIVSSIYEKEIYLQLERIGCTNRIINVEDYKSEMIARIQKDKYYCYTHRKEKNVISCVKHLTVYTTIFDDYDFLIEPEFISEKINYVCFTDNPELISKNWEIRYVNREFYSSILESRKYKMLSHRYIKNEYSLYIDANIKLLKNPIEYFEKYMDDTNILLIPHNQRICIYDEIATCILIRKDNVDNLIKQANKYILKGCPAESGLFAGGIIGRKNNEKNVIVFNELWWEEYKKYSNRDQISLAYLAWKNKINFAIADINIRNNEWFYINKHKNGD